MDITNIVKLVIISVVITAAGTLVHAGYAKIKDIGYQEAQVKYEKIIKTHEDGVNKKIQEIIDTTSLLVSENRATSASLSTDISVIMKGIKGKTLTIVKDGKCVPSPEFLNTFDTVNKRVNKSIKDSSK